MHDGWRRELIQYTASLKLTRPSGDYVVDPFAFPTVGERNQESVGHSKNIHWRAVNLAGFPANVCKDTEARKSGGESDGDSVRHSQVKGCDPSLAEPDQKDGSQQNCQKRDDRRGDDHAPTIP